MKKDKYLEKINIIFSIIVTVLGVGLASSMVYFCYSVNQNAASFIEAIPIFALLFMIAVVYNCWNIVETKYIKKHS